MDKSSQSYEYIGKLNPDIAKYWRLDEHANKPIIIFYDRREHIIDKHLKDFGSEEKIDYIWSKLGIIIKHILPQTTSFAIVAMTLSVPSYILSESGLSFLGLGIQQPDASWGNMLKEAQEFTNIIYRPWLLTPGFLIFIAVLAFNLIGDTIRDILDPKSKVR